MNQEVGLWILGIVVVVAQTALTTCVGLWIKKRWDKKEEERKELDNLREKQRDDAERKRCEDMKVSIHEEFRPVLADMDLMKKGMQKDIRRSLRQDAAHYLSRGYASFQEKTEYDELYWCYHNLGKNGVVDNDHKRVMSLPDTKGE